VARHQGLYQGFQVQLVNAQKLLEGALVVPPVPLK
jgi:hypothetical protein